MQFARNAARGGWEGFCEETAIGRRFCQDAAKRQRPQGTVQEGRGGSASVCRATRRQAASKARGCGQLRERGAAGGREGAEERGRLQELEVADGCGNGGDRRRLREHRATGGHESTGPRAATKAWDHGRPQKRGAADGRGVRKLRAAMGCPIMSAGRSGEQGWEWLRRAGYAGDLASMLPARRLPGPSAHNVARKR